MTVNDTVNKTATADDATNSAVVGQPVTAFWECRMWHQFPRRIFSWSSAHHAPAASYITRQASRDFISYGATATQNASFSRRY